MYTPFGFITTDVFTSRSIELLLIDGHFDLLCSIAELNQVIIGINFAARQTQHDDSQQRDEQPFHKCTPHKCAICSIHSIHVSTIKLSLIRLW